jgi:hypothetical protein
MEKKTEKKVRDDSKEKEGKVRNINIHMYVCVSMYLCV